MLKSIGLYVVAAGAIFSAGMFFQMYRGSAAVIEDQVKQAEVVNVLQKGVLKDAIKTSEVVRYIKTAPDATKCIPVRMRDFDIDALGGVQRNSG